MQSSPTPTRDPRSRLFTARQLLRDGHLEEADKLARAVAKEEPSLLAATLDVQARVRRAQKRPDEARAHWEEALQLEPANNEYRRALERLDGPNLTGWLVSVPVAFAAVVSVWFLVDRMGNNETQAAERMGELEGELLHQAAVNADVQQGHARRLEEQGARLQGLVDAVPVERQRNQAAREGLRSELGDALSSVRAEAQQSDTALGLRLDEEESARAVAVQEQAAARERLEAELRGVVGGVESQLVQSTQALEDMRREDLARLDARDAELAQADAAAAEQRTQLSAELAAARTQGESERASMEGALAALSQTVDAQGNGLGALAGEQSQLAQRLESLDVQQRDLLQSIEAGEQARAAFQTRTDALLERVDAMEALDAQTRSDLEELLASRATLAEVSALRDALASSQAQVASLEERLTDSESRTVNAEAQVVTLVDLLLELEQRLAALEDE